MRIMKNINGSKIFFKISPVGIQVSFYLMGLKPNT